MQGNIYREVFPTFLAKKLHEWWITRRRMEIYTKISKRKDLVWSRQKQGKIRTTHGLCEFGRCCAKFSHKPRAVVFQRPYLPHFSSKSYTVWSVGFLTSWDLKRYIACKKWTSGSTPKVPKKTADAVLCFPPCFSLLCFPLLHCSFLAYFERIWQRDMELQSLVLHEFELPKALP